MSGLIPWQLAVWTQDAPTVDAVGRFTVLLKIQFETHGYQMFNTEIQVFQEGFIVSANIASEYPLMGAAAFSFLPEWKDFIGAY